MVSLAKRLITCKSSEALTKNPSLHTLCLVRYVDEAQDNLLIDALRSFPLSIVIIHADLFFLVLRSLVRNPDGLFWAGDTAQTISVGSSFRFNDLKAFLYRLEVHLCITLLVYDRLYNCDIDTKRTDSARK